MNKPLTTIIKDTKTKIADVINESSLPPVILDLIFQGIYSEIHYIAEKQTIDEEAAYLKLLEESAAKDSKEDGNEEK